MVDFPGAASLFQLDGRWHYINAGVSYGTQLNRVRVCLRGKNFDTAYQYVISSIPNFDCGDADFDWLDNWKR